MIGLAIADLFSDLYFFDHSDNNSLRYFISLAVTSWILFGRTSGSPRARALAPREKNTNVVTRLTYTRFV